MIEFPDSVTMPEQEESPIANESERGIGQSSTYIDGYEERRRERNRSMELAQRHQRREEQLMCHGWRYVRVTKTLCVLVPCNKKGVPTPEGEEIIKRNKKRYEF